jgi:hypothetical protein
MRHSAYRYSSSHSRTVPINSNITPTNSDVIAENRIKLQILDNPETAHAVAHDTRFDRETDINTKRLRNVV